MKIIKIINVVCIGILDAVTFRFKIQFINYTFITAGLNKLENLCCFNMNCVIFRILTLLIYSDIIRPNPNQTKEQGA